MTLLRTYIGSFNFSVKLIVCLYRSRARVSTRVNFYVKLKQSTAIITLHQPTHSKHSQTSNTLKTLQIVSQTVSKHSQNGKAIMQALLDPTLLARGYQGSRIHQIYVYLQRMRRLLHHVGETQTKEKKERKKPLFFCLSQTLIQRFFLLILRAS